MATMKQLIAAGIAKAGDVYYTVVIPYQAENATEWHPTDKEGPFSTLTRGRFKTAGEASYWAKQHLGVGAWYVKACECTLCAEASQ